MPFSIKKRGSQRYFGVPRRGDAGVNVGVRLLVSRTRTERIVRCQSCLRDGGLSNVAKGWRRPTCGEFRPISPVAHTPLTEGGLVPVPSRRGFGPALKGVPEICGIAEPQRVRNVLDGQTRVA